MSEDKVDPIDAGQEVLRSRGCTLGYSGDEVTIQCDDSKDASDLFWFLEWLTDALDNPEVREALAKVPK